MLFSGYMIEYTTVFNQIKRSKDGKVCDAFNNILEYKGQLCYIPTGNAFFKKSLEYIYKRDFSNEYKEFMLDSDRRKNIMTSTKIQPFCRIYNINLGVKTKINDQFYLKVSPKEESVYLFTTIIFALYGKTIIPGSLML